MRGLPRASGVGCCSVDVGQVDDDGVGCISEPPLRKERWSTAFFVHAVSVRGGKKTVNGRGVGKPDGWHS